jgi:hypothetical protein
MPAEEAHLRLRMVGVELDDLREVVLVEQVPVLELEGLDPLFVLQHLQSLLECPQRRGSAFHRACSHPSPISSLQDDHIR